MKARQMSKISQDFNKHSEMISPRNADSEQPFHIKRCMFRPEIINAFTVPTLTLFQPLPYKSYFHL